MKQRRTQRIAYRRIASVALNNCDAILQRWLPGGDRRSREYVVRNPKRADAHPGSFSINIDTGRWADFATGDSGGDLISLAAYLFDLSQAKAAIRLANMLGEPPHD